MKTVAVCYSHCCLKFLFDWTHEDTEAGTGSKCVRTALVAPQTMSGVANKTHGSSWDNSPATLALALVADPAPNSGNFH